MLKCSYFGGRVTVPGDDTRMKLNRQLDLRILILLRRRIMANKTRSMTELGTWNGLNWTPHPLPHTHTHTHRILLFLIYCLVTVCIHLKKIHIVLCLFVTHPIKLRLRSQSCVEKKNKKQPHLNELKQNSDQISNDAISVEWMYQDYRVTHFTFHCIHTFKKVQYL